MPIQKNQEAVVINPETQVVVFYHKNCNDGFVAGFVWWLHHLNDTRIHQYIPLQYKEEVGDLTGKQVVMLDVTVTPKQFQEIKRVAKSVLVLDHHEGTLEDYQKAFDEGKYGFNKCRCGESPDEKTFHFSHEHKPASNVTFSKEKQSGALMAYDYLLDEPIPNCSIAQGLARKQLKYICERISDRDLRNFNYPDSKAVYEVISNFNFNFRQLFELLICTEKLFKSLVEQAQITTHLTQIPQPVIKKENEMTTINLSTLVALAQPTHSDEFTQTASTIAPGKLGDKIQSLLQRKEDEKMDAAAETIVNLIKLSGDAISNSVDRIREARQLIAAEKAKIEQIEMASMFGSETMNYLPLLKATACNHMTQETKVVDLSKIPEDFEKKYKDSKAKEGNPTATKKTIAKKTTK